MILRFVRFVAITFALALGGALTAIVIWSVLQPINGYRGVIASRLSRTLDAKSAVIENLSWDVAPTSLAIGLHARNTILRDAPAFREIKLESVGIYVQPLKVIMGELPIRVHVNGGSIDLRSESAKPTLAPQTRVTPQIPLSVRRARVHIDTKNIRVLLSGDPHKGAGAALSNVEGDFHMVGLPGNLSVHMKSQLDFMASDGQWIRGPFQLDSEGHFLLEDKVPIAINADNTRLDLTQLELNSNGEGGFLEKDKGIQLSATLPLRVLLHEDYAPKAFEINGGSVTYDRLPISLSGLMHASGRKLELKWNIPRSDVVNLHLPLHFLHGAAASGVVESGGQFKMVDGYKEGSWKLGLNNLLIETAAFSQGRPGLAFSGPLRLSLATEGRVMGDKISSDRSEIQMNATGAQLSFLNEQLQKPKGGALELLLQANIKDDSLNINKAYLTLHNMTVLSNAELAGFSQFLKERKAKLRFNLSSDRVDLSTWAAYFPIFRRLPLEGFVQAAGAVNGPIDLSNEEASFRNLSWRIDRFNISSLRGAFDPEIAKQFDAGDRYQISGPFTLDFLLQARGKGSRVERASLQSRADLNRLSFIYKNIFRKMPSTPLSIEVAAEQSSNSVTVRRGRLRLHELDMDFSGEMNPNSSRGFIKLAMQRPVNLGEWNQLFLTAPTFPLSGRVLWNGRLFFDSSNGWEAGLDWKRLSLDGTLSFLDINGRVGNMRHPLRNAQGRLQISNGVLSVPDFNLGLGGSKIRFSGRAEPAETHGKNGVSLQHLLTRKNWNMNAQVAMSRLDMEDFSFLPDGEESDENESASLAPQLQALLQNPYLKESQIDVSLRADQGRLADLTFAALNARARWQKGKLQLDPLGVKAFGGQLNGQFTFDSSPWQQSKALPRLSAALKSKDLDIKALSARFKPSFEKLLGGRLDGDLEVSSAGFDVNEAIQNAKGRVHGQLRDGEFKTLMAVQDALNGLVKNSDAKDYLLRQASTEQCVRERFNARIDVNLSGGEVAISAAEIDFATGSRMLLSGALDKALNVNVAGEFLASDRCIGGDARSCLKGSSGQATLPFRIEGPASDAKASMDIQGIGRRVASCAADIVKRKAEAAVRREYQQKVAPKVQELENKAKEEIKKGVGDLFKFGN